MTMRSFQCTEVLTPSSLIAGTMSSGSLTTGVAWNTNNMTQIGSRSFRTYIFQNQNIKSQNRNQDSQQSNSQGIFQQEISKSKLQLQRNTFKG